MENNYSSGFERFWKLYPRKKGGGKAVAALVWNRKVKPLFEQDVIDALQAQLDAGMFGTEKKYMPHGRTWLNQQRWEDEIEKSSTTAGHAAPVHGKYDELL